MLHSYTLTKAGYILPNKHQCCSNKHLLPSSSQLLMQRVWKYTIVS